MSSEHQLPDYELGGVQIGTEPRQLKAMFPPLRSTLLDLVLERAATVGELAAAVQRNPGTVAYHVRVLAEAGLFQVVRTRKIRSIDERFYGRTARVFSVGQVNPEQVGMMSNALI